MTNSNKLFSKRLFSALSIIIINTCLAEIKSQTRACQEINKPDFSKELEFEIDLVENAENVFGFLVRKGSNPQDKVVELNCLRGQGWVIEPLRVDRRVERASEVEFEINQFSDRENFQIGNIRSRLQRRTRCHKTKQLYNLNQPKIHQYCQKRICPKITQMSQTLRQKHAACSYDRNSLIDAVKSYDIEMGYMEKDLGYYLDLSHELEVEVEYWKGKSGNVPLEDPFDSKECMDQEKCDEKVEEIRMAYETNYGSARCDFDPDLFRSYFDDEAHRIKKSHHPFFPIPPAKTTWSNRNTILPSATSQPKTSTKL